MSKASIRLFLKNAGVILGERKPGLERPFKVQPCVAMIDFNLTQEKSDKTWFTPKEKR